MSNLIMILIFIYIFFIMISSIPYEKVSDIIILPTVFTMLLLLYLFSNITDTNVLIRIYLFLCNVLFLLYVNTFVPYDNINKPHTIKIFLFILSVIYVVNIKYNYF